MPRDDRTLPIDLRASERSDSVIPAKRRRVRDSEEVGEELGEKETRWEEPLISRKAPPTGYNIHKKKEHSSYTFYRQELPNTH